MKTGKNLNAVLKKYTPVHNNLCELKDNFVVTGKKLKTSKSTALFLYNETDKNNYDYSRYPETLPGCFVFFNSKAGSITFDSIKLENCKPSKVELSIPYQTDDSLILYLSCSLFDIPSSKYSGTEQEIEYNYIFKWQTKLVKLYSKKTSSKSTSENVTTSEKTEISFIPLNNNLNKEILLIHEQDTFKKGSHEDMSTEREENKCYTIDGDSLKQITDTKNLKDFPPFIKCKNGTQDSQ
ncbi:hypothetical protein KKF34_17140 [Myxococcota bacterium]|nr:hypothetical protein [Myxococcota bacterium]MBU1379675.1 hypothetical protein [Myxococcota bacterium]MBU1498606.1 hypothetical protein [Myxococcota bacterium]